jgi:cystathionine gamma-synthase
MSDDKSAQTVAAANGIAADERFGAVAPALYLSSTFAFAGFQQARRYDYSRTNNPTRDLLADTLAKLEDGAGAVVVSSGMAAVNLLLADLKPTELVVAPHDCYAGTHRLLNARHGRGQFDVRFIDQADEEQLSCALKQSPRLILVETPSNPLMRITDIRTIAARARSVGAKVAVDNTFLSPALQKPLTLGADFVIHSTTKYLNGHSDVIGGAVIAAQKADAEKIAEWANTTGVTGAPFDAYLTLRGLRTLFPRIENQQKTAAALAHRLNGHPHVRKVHYPGLPDHPGHAVAKGQQRGFGAMLSFDLLGDLRDVQRFVESLRIFTLAESLGGIESLIAHPATMTHACLSQEVRSRAGISDTLLRMSVGLEAENDLWADLSRGFEVLSPTAGRRQVRRET